MVDRTLDDLNRVAELVPLLDADLQVCEQRCQALRSCLFTLRKALMRLPSVGHEFVDNLVEYIITTNGKRKPATEGEVNRLRRTWRGDFLLDIPGRVLRVRRGIKVVKLQLGNGHLHRGLEQVLVLGMLKPGRLFGHRVVSCRTGKDHRAVGINVLTRYVFTIRHVIGDSGRVPNYLLNTDVDRSLSDTCRGYVFSDRWTYMVIERRNRDDSPFGV